MRQERAAFLSCGPFHPCLLNTWFVWQNAFCGTVKNLPQFLQFFDGFLVFTSTRTLEYIIIESFVMIINFEDIQTYTCVPKYLVVFNTTLELSTRNLNLIKPVEAKFYSWLRKRTLSRAWRYMARVVDAVANVILQSGPVGAGLYLLSKTWDRMNHDVKDEICAKLDTRSRSIKNWWHVAYELDLTRSQIEDLKYPTNPAKMLMAYVYESHREITVGEVIGVLMSERQRQRNVLDDLRDLGQ